MRGRARAAARVRSGAPCALLALAPVLALLAGCATQPQHGGAPGEPPPQEISGPELSAGEVRAYNDIDSLIVTSGGRTWMILPTDVLAVNGTFVEYRFGTADGILGPILSLDHDDYTLYLGTTAGVNLIDTRSLTIDAFIPGNDSTDLYIRWLHADSRRDIWAVSREGVAWLDVGSRTWRTYPFERFTYADLRKVVFDGQRIWFATRQGLRRFSREWKAWDPVPGGRELASIEIMGLQRDHDGYLWAMTPPGLYRYSPSFDSWEFVGR